MKHTHYFITNRFIEDKSQDHLVEDIDRIDDSGKKMAQHNLRIGIYSFSSESDLGKVELIEEKSRELGVASFAEAAKERAKLPSVQLFYAQHSSMLKAKSESLQGDVLFYVHGFNCTFKESLELIRKLHYTYVENEETSISQIVAFCWPSNGKLLEYRDDAEDAIQSGKTLARMYNKLIGWLKREVVSEKFVSCDRDVHLLAHSMGGRVIDAMMAELNSNQQSRKSVFGEVVLANVDVDYDCFEPQGNLYNLIDLCSRIHVYYHNRDRALLISENTKNALNRLGRWGCKNTSSLPDDVYQCDITDMDDDNGTIWEKIGNHWAYYSSNPVVEDIQTVLLGGLSAFYK